ncbi:MAG: roadblock/LC7 domain-containing protein [Nitrospirae bacterium]|nr:roadblock/LC7 domain-containing protein [Nitrospirota bacterium]
MDEQNVLTSDVFERIEAELRGFRQLAKARGVLLVNRSGQLFGQAGDTSRMDTTALAALVASNVAASRAIADLVGEREFKGVFLEGDREHIHISLVGSGTILAVLFDSQTSLGLVRLRVKSTAKALDDLLRAKAQRVVHDDPVLSPFAEITEEDIDQLFR